jgi:predicted component of type VI protein secretion system
MGAPESIDAIDVEMYEGRIERATRAIQSGVHWRQGFQRDTEAALRTAIVTGMADHTALLNTLVNAGLITRADYLRQQAEERERAAELLTHKIGRYLGREVDLYGPE